jgi:isopenicillin-N N-acyltransferase-like protein
MALGQACLEEHYRYSPALMEELRGMSEATGLSMAELVIMNGFTDFVDVVYSLGEKVMQPQPSDNCTAFLVPGHLSADGYAMYGQTWDMHDSATPYVILIHGEPDDAPKFLTFTITGCVGMVGMNEAGIAVGINNLTASDGQIGVTWTFVIREALRQTTLDAALNCITSAKLAGGHNYLLMDKHGDGYNVEAMSTRCHVEKLDDSALVHTNHCLVNSNTEVERTRTPESLASSKARLNRAEELLARDAITPEALMELTRDPQAICVRSAPPSHIESCGAAIMRPRTGDFWAVWGLPAENEYEHFTI